MTTETNDFNQSPIFDDALVARFAYDEWKLDIQTSFL